MLLQRLYRITNCNRILRRAVLYKNIHPVCKVNKKQNITAIVTAIIT